MRSQFSLTGQLAWPVADAFGSPAPRIRYAVVIKHSSVFVFSFFRVFGICLLPGTFACQPADKPKVELPAQESNPLSRGVRYLLDHQSADGAWRSEVYGHFRGGDALTPLIVVTLKRCPETAETEEAIRKGLAWLLATKPDDDLNYPVYTAALSISALNGYPHDETPAVCRSWTKLLDSWQMTETTGWQPGDWQYGGWGYSGIVPQKPAQGPVPEALDANLSATAYALEALQVMRKPKNDPMWSKARTFVERCQNFAEPPTPVDDGGFFFVPNDPFRNKAGLIRDAQGKVRYRSYGSATVDGLRCLAALGVPDDHPRVVAAKRWLQEQQKDNPAGHPGRYAEDRQTDRDGPFFYYCAGLATLKLPGFREELVRRQRPDGSWRNDCAQVREDDPLLATALAVYALAKSQP
jgi:hypothetical protein